MYAFAQRADARVVDEPFYAYYLAKTGKEHPGRAETLASQPLDIGEIMDGLDQLKDRDLLFVKNMSKHMQLLPPALFSEMMPVHLIREPAALISSFIKGVPDPGMDDIGLVYQHQLVQEELAQGTMPIVLDTTEVLKNPGGVLGQLCDRLGIPYDHAMTTWEPGPRPEDGVWAKHWYANVHTSAGFKPYQSREVVLPAHCDALYEASRALYEELYLLAIKA